MTTPELITALFYHVDEQLRTVPKHPEARLWPSEVGTLGLLHALKGGGTRAFYRWLTRDYRALFPRLPERTRLFASSGPIRPGPRLSWPLPRSSASSTPMGSS
jgi:hypothetical protein